ncbi:MAG: SpoIIIAH-like family protein [Clostridiales bacterium]|jgi:hypothetical protein|nr:SpoIIIAH-like family protein [Clostridiales bacterium]
MKKNIWVIAGLAALLAIAVFVNVRVNKAADAVPLPTDTVEKTSGMGDETVTVTEDYFETFRADRENVRDKELAYLNDIIGHEATDAETLADAQSQKLALVDGMEKEFTIESLLLSKGFQDAAITFHKGSTNVVIHADALSAPQVAQILEIVCRETGEDAKNIKISVVNGKK